VLMLRSEPAGARILYNGKISKVVTPTVLKSIPVGQEELIRFNMEGYKDKEIKVVLKRDEIKEMNVKLVPLTPTIRVLTSPPGAEIFLDGKSTGKLTPSSISKLEADRNYSVKTILKGYRALEREVKPMKDEEVLIEFDLEKERHKSNNVQKAKEKFGLLDVNTTPPTKIYIDGRYSGFHSPVKGIKLKPGSHEIKLINPEKNVHNINKVNIEVGTPASIDKVF